MCWSVRCRTGRLRGCFSEGESFPHLAEALDGVLRRLGGTARSWRTDRMATSALPESDRLRPEAAAMAKHYGVQVAVCPPKRPQRKGVVEKAIDYVTQSAAALGAGVIAGAGASRSALLVCGGCPIAAGGDGARWLAGSGELLLALPELPFPACYREERVVSRDALVEFETNRYSVGPGHAGATVEVRARLGELYLEIYTPSGHRMARHRRALSGVGQPVPPPSTPARWSGRCSSSHH